MNKLALVLALVAAPAVAVAENHLMDNNKTVTYDCDKDAVTNIMGNENTITLKGACTDVNISGNKNKITGANAKKLNVSGNENTLDFQTPEQINVSGNSNTLSYGKAAKPKVANVGTGNKIGGK